MSRDPAAGTTCVLVLDQTTPGYRRHYYFEADSYNDGDLIIGKDHRGGAPSSGTWAQSSYSIQRIGATSLRFIHSHSSTIDPFTLTVLEIPTGAKGDRGDRGPPGTGEDNVQPDWVETDPVSDAFILNKPTLGALAALDALAADSVTPEMLDADSTADKTAFRARIGTGSAAVEDVGTGNGDIAVLGSGGRFEAARLTQPFTAIARSSALTWNVGSNPKAEITMNGNVSSMSLSGDIDGGIYVMEIHQDGTGGRTMDFPDGWYWPGGGTEPSLSTDANATDILTIMKTGSRVYAVLTTGWAT